MCAKVMTLWNEVVTTWQSRLQAALRNVSQSAKLKYADVCVQLLLASPKQMLHQMATRPTSLNRNGITPEHSDEEEQDSQQEFASEDARGRAQERLENEEAATTSTVPPPPAKEAQEIDNGPINACTLSPVLAPHLHQKSLGVSADEICNIDDLDHGCGNQFQASAVQIEAIAKTFMDRDVLPHALAPSPELNPRAISADEICSINDVDYACGNQPKDLVEVSQPLIVFDWDDTLFPTKWVEKKKPVLDRSAARKTGDSWNKLKKHSRAVENVLGAALDLGHVAIVTLADPLWLQEGIQQFMPELAELVKKLDIFYARDMPADGQSDQYMHQKKEAMMKALRSCDCVDGQKVDSSRGLVSIGDSTIEARAARCLRRECQKDGTLGWAKTIKVQENPSIDVLTSQLLVLSNHLAGVVSNKGDEHLMPCDLS